MPFLVAAGELKTKPSQQSVAKLREIGLQPDILVCRAERSLGMEVREKLAMFCNVPVEAVVEERDVETSIYELPLMLQQEKVDDLVVEYLGLNAPPKPMDAWIDVVRRLRFPAEEVTVAVVGKYIELQDAYKSVYESLTHAGIANDAHVHVKRIDAEDLETGHGKQVLWEMDGIVVPGGFWRPRHGGQNICGSICPGKRDSLFRPLPGDADRRHRVFPGMWPGYTGPIAWSSTKNTPHPVIHLMEDQKEVTQKGASMRLGAYTCQLVHGSKSHGAYRFDTVRETPPAPL